MRLEVFLCWQIWSTLKIPPPLRKFWFENIATSTLASTDSTRLLIQRPCSPRSPACFCSLKVKPVTYLHSHSRNQQSTYEKVNVFHFHKALFEPSPSPFRRFALWFRFPSLYVKLRPRRAARPCHAVTKWKWRLLDIPTFKVTKTVLLKEGAKLYKMSKDLRAVTIHNGVKYGRGLTVP